MVMTVDLGTPIPKGMRWAANTARFSDHPVHKMGAVLVSGGNIVAVGHNKNRSHPKSPHKFCIHAEVDTLLTYGTADGWDATMYVARVTKGGQWGTSRPCNRCMVLMREYGVKDVVFVDENGRIKKENL